MWYTVLHEATPIGVVELPPAGLAANSMLRFPAYEAVGATTRAATSAVLQIGLFGGALPALPPYQAALLRLRRAMVRAGRLRFVLMDARGAVADASFVNLLQPASDDRVVVVAGFSHASAHAGARMTWPPGEVVGGA